MKQLFNGPWKVPQIYQREAAECVLACIAMLANRSDPRWTLSDLRTVVPTSSRGSSVATALAALQSIGFSAYATSVDLADLGSLSGPAILHWNFDHYVIYAGRKGEHHFINDPVSGPRRIEEEELSDCFTGVLIVVEGEVVGPPALNMKRRLALTDLLVFDVNYRSIISEVIALTICVQIAVLSLPFLMSRIIGTSQVNVTTQPFKIVLYFVGAYFLVSVYSILCTSLKDWAIVRVGQHIEFNMSDQLFSRLFRKSISFIRRRNSSDLDSRFDSTGVIGMLFSHGIVAAAFELLTLIFSGIALVALAPKVASITIIGAAAYTAFRIKAMKWTIPLSEGLLLSENSYKSHTLETIRSHHVLVACDALETRRESWKERLDAKLIYSRRMSSLQGIINTLRSGIPAVELSAVLLVGVLLVQKGQISIGAFVAVLAYRQRLFDVASGVTDRYASWREMRVHLDRIEDVWADELSYSIAVDPLQESFVSLKQISYCYPGESISCIDKVSMEVVKGDVIAVVGPTGSGKSTLLSIAAGHEKPTEGLVTCSPEMKGRGAVAIVFQDEVIFDTTILENVLMGRSGIDHSEVEKALEGASLLDDVRAMSAGLNSIVGPGGAFLSGGQRQRLTIARALLGRPKLLILDEATSNLDVATEQAVMTAVLECADAIVYAAHRPEAINRSNKVLVLER